MDSGLEGIEYKAFYIASAIEIAAYRQQNEMNLFSSSSSELYYHLPDNKYVYLFNYGVVVFANFTESEAKHFIKKIRSFAKGKSVDNIMDDLSVVVHQDSHKLDMAFDHLSIGRFNHEINKAIMLNLAQSVCLDQFTEESQQLLGELKSSTLRLGISGKIRINQKAAMRMAGRSLATKNSIAENLYILDSPDITWEDEFIDLLHKTLSRHFELTFRYQSIENTLKIIDENLSLYITYNQHRESSRLEWIIIILIIIEVVDTLLSKLL